MTAGVATGVFPSVRAVVTTGIYCRDGCPARPAGRNVRPYPAAVAAAAAGYRPCLRCRPDRRADGLTWLEAPELVRRALVAIADGGLDEATEDDLAVRLGVSARHLRRLFAEHVGATPDGVARSRRAHFARRLLDETDLPLVEVAAHAGFGSARQLHRVLTDLFGFPPSELRARRQRGDRLVADGGLALRLPVGAPVAWPATLAHLAARAAAGVESVAGDRYRAVLDLHGNPSVVEVGPGDDGSHLRLVVHLPRFEPLLDVVTAVRRLLGLDRPVVAATPLAGDPVIGPLAAGRPGLRAMGSADRFSGAVRIVLGQQVSVAAAATLASRLAHAAGTPVDGLGGWGLDRTSPGPAAVAALDPAALAMPRRRAEAVIGLGRAVADGVVALDDPDVERVRAALWALPGVGPWTVEVIAGRVLGDDDAFAAGDLGLRKALATDGTVPTAADAAIRAERWRPHRTLAAAHLWASLAPGLGERPPG